MSKKPSREQPEATQKTQPKKGEPVEIPIPTESQIERDFTKIATRRFANDEDEGSENEDVG